MHMMMTFYFLKGKENNILRKQSPRGFSQSYVTKAGASPAGSTPSTLQCLEEVQQANRGRRYQLVAELINLGFLEEIQR